MSGKLTTVARYFHPTDAHIAAGRLKAQGIPVFLRDINHASVNWLICIALGGIRLQVPDDCVALSRSILEEEFEPVAEACCPQCGSGDVSNASRRWKLSVLAVHLFSLPLPWRRNARICDSCGHEWETADRLADRVPPPDPK